MHKSIAVLAGAAGGAFGISSLPVELPFSTTIMLRSIADIARAEGQDLTDPKTALACLEVFALGARDGSNRDIRFPDIDVPDSNLVVPALETGYFALRAILAKSADRSGAISPAALPRARPRRRCPLGGADRHSLAWLSRKVVAQSVPLIGAAGRAY
jgi:hypothetical protein